MISGRALLCMLAAPLVLAALLDNPYRPDDGAFYLPDSLRVDTTMVSIDFDRALAVTIPAGADRTAVAFTTPDGREGWGVKIPGNRPIATPAYADGMIFVGGGYGSHEFYAFDAKSGKLIWEIRTSDDGPTAAVVEDGYVAFNTESCTVIVVEAKSGKLVWQEWLGDPLMSQPAIADGRLYIAYPANGRQHMQNNHPNAMQMPHEDNAAAMLPLPPIHSASPSSAGGSHRMLCADLRTGRHIWEQPITGDVISAPVVDSGKVFFTCFDGRSYSFDAVTGELLWQKENAGTSAPLILDGVVVTTKKEDREGRTYEGIQTMSVRGDEEGGGVIAASEAEYLKKDNGGGVGLAKDLVQQLDNSVGFSSAPATAKLEAANDHIGVSTVAGGWAYQGARAAHKRGQIMNAQGRYLNNVRASDGSIAWRAEAIGSAIDKSAQIFSPPAVGEEYLYISTVYGHIGSVRQKDGVPGFLYNIGHPTTFQPALAEGNVYVGTADGWLICLKTGTPDADGWYAWGGNARHNKK